jgi:hypothetical protein
MQVEAKLTLKKGQPIVVSNTDDVCIAPHLPPPLKGTKEQKELLRKYAVVIDEAVRFSKPGADTIDPLDDDNSTGKRDGFVEATFTHTSTCGKHPVHKVIQSEGYSVVGPTKENPGGTVQPNYIKIERLEATVAQIRKLIFNPSSFKSFGGQESVYELEGVSCGNGPIPEMPKPALKAYVRLRSADEWYFYLKMKEGITFKIGGGKERVRSAFGKQKVDVTTTSRSASGETFGGKKIEASGKTVTATVDGQHSFSGYSTSVKQDGVADPRFSAKGFDDGGKKDNSIHDAQRTKARKDLGDEDQFEKMGREVSESFMRFKKAEEEDPKQIDWGVKLNGVELEKKKVTELLQTIKDGVNTTLDIVDSVYDAVQTAMSTGVPWTFKFNWSVDISLFQGGAFLQVWNKIEPPVTGPTYHLAQTKTNWQLALELTLINAKVTISIAGIIQVIHERVLSLSLTLSLTIEGAAKMKLPLFKNGDAAKQVDGENPFTVTPKIVGQGTAGPYEITATGQLKGGLKHTWVWSFSGFDFKLTENKLVSEAITFRFTVTKGNKLKAVVREFVDEEEKLPKPGEEVQDPDTLYVWPKEGPKELLKAEYVNKDFLAKPGATPAPAKP